MLQKTDAVVLRRIHGSIFLIDITDNYFGDRCALFEINETGEFIWNNIDGHLGVPELVNLLQAALVDEVPYEMLHEDIQEYVEELKSKGFVFEVAENG